MIKVYKNAPRENLIEWLKAHINPVILAEMSQEELVKQYAEGLAHGAAANLKGWKKLTD
jgi:hypothetical protein